MTRRLVPVWLVLAAAGGLLATGTLDEAPADAPDIGTARVAFNETSIESAEYATGIDLVASYAVVHDRLSTNGTIDADHQMLWNTVAETLPARWRRSIRQFTVVNQGVAGTVAMVHQSGLDPDRWLLSIDIADAANHRLVRDTLVHELAHLITLRPSEFTFNHRFEGVCDGVKIDVGCAHADSILARWAETFWTQPDHAAPDDPLVYVAPYAASGPHEDLAETFLFWMRDGGTDAPDDSVLAAKFAFIETELAGFVAR